jgi:hypothetical protein
MQARKTPTIAFSLSLASARECVDLFGGILFGVGADRARTSASSKRSSIRRAKRSDGRENEESGVEPGKDHYVAHEVDSKPAHAKTGVCGTWNHVRNYRLCHPHQVDEPAPEASGELLARDSRRSAYLKSRYDR